MLSQDTGCGIPEEEQGNLFQLFTRIAADQPNKELSTGLGLVLSRTIARSLNGDLYLVSSTPMETTFCLRLPYTLSTDPPQPSPLLLTDSPSDPSQGSKKRRKKRSASSYLTRDLQDKSVLVVDDNPLIVRVLEKILEGCRHLQTASNGQEALNIVTQRMKSGEEFDLIFMDCLMPVMDGYTATQTMRQLGYKGPILALTGNSSEQDAERAREAGYSSTVVKPIRSDDLIGIIRQWAPPPIDQKRSHSSLSSSSSSPFDPVIDSPTGQPSGSICLTQSSRSTPSDDRTSFLSDSEASHAGHVQKSDVVKMSSLVSIPHHSLLPKGVAMVMDAPSDVGFKSKKVMSQPFPHVKSDLEMMEREKVVEVAVEEEKEPQKKKKKKGKHDGGGTDELRRKKHAKLEKEKGAFI